MGHGIYRSGTPVKCLECGVEGEYYRKKWTRRHFCPNCKGWELRGKGKHGAPVPKTAAIDDLPLEAEFRGLYPAFYSLVVTDYYKTGSSTRHDQKGRKCIKCGTVFKSKDSGHRKCGTCVQSRYGAAAEFI